MRKYKEARQFCYPTASEAAKKLGVSQPTISAWEAGRKTPSIEALENMADLYGVTTDYLLGREEVLQPNHSVENRLLAVFDGRPVWSPKYGWLLVNAREHQLLSSTGRLISFADVGELYTTVQPFMQSPLPTGTPIPKEKLKEFDVVWVEPISPDQFLREELRGWYKVKLYWVENTAGNRFSLDCYGTKWVSYEEQP